MKHPYVYGVGDIIMIARGRATKGNRDSLDYAKNMYSLAFCCTYQL